MKAAVTYTVDPPRPYSLRLTAARYQRFPEVVDRFDGVRYRRLLPIGRSAVLLTVTQEGSPSRARLLVTLDGKVARTAAARAAADRVLSRSLGASSPVAPFYRALAADPVLAAPIGAFRGLRIAGWPSLWEALATSVLCQQVNLAFAYDIRRELAEALGRRARFDGEVFYAFPAPQRMALETESALKRFRLSGAKAGAVARLAAAFASRELAEEPIQRLSDEAAIQKLVEIKGVGRWTAEIALLRGLGRADVFPAADLGVVGYVAKGLLGRADRATEREMRTYAERWRPFRGLALVYAYAELERRRRAAAL